MENKENYHSNRVSIVCVWNSTPSLLLLSGFPFTIPIVFVSFLFSGGCCSAFQTNANEMQS